LSKFGYLDKQSEQVNFMLRRAYNWVRGWSEIAYGSWSLFLLAFAESSWFPVEPDMWLIVQKEK
jgi:hypothetical protein